MALIYFYDATDLDRDQLTQGLQDTDHHWEFIEEKISLENLNPETEVISMFVISTITREMIERLPKLRVIACRSTGFNNVDLDAATEHGVAVLNVPSYGESTVAEYAFTLISALLRKLPKTLEAENGDFNQKELRGTDLHEKTLGVIGTGRIGQHAIKIGNGYGMKVIGYDAYPKDELQEELGFTYFSLDEVLHNADVITLHLPYLPSTHHLINSDNLSKMKSTAILVNTARGEIVDTNALVSALNQKKIAGAALDVVEGEALLHNEEEAMLLRSQTIPDKLLRHSMEISYLKKMPNVIITPHNAFNTIEAIGRINQTTTDNIKRFWYGDTPNLIKPPKKQTGKLLLSRHTESEWNATGKWSGTRDVHLDDRGFHDAAQFGLVIKQLDIPIDYAYCSQQIRTRETMEGILNASQQFDVDITTSSAINERDYGDYTGKNKWEMKEMLGEETFHAIRRGWDVPIPNGETLKMVYERVVPFYKETILPLLLDGKNVMIVAHGNSIRALMKYIENISDEDVEELEMIFGQLIQYDVDEEGHKVEKFIHKIDTIPPKA